MATCHLVAFAALGLRFLVVDAHLQPEQAGKQRLDVDIRPDAQDSSASTASMMRRARNIKPQDTVVAELTDTGSLDISTSKHTSERADDHAIDSKAFQQIAVRLQTAAERLHEVFAKHRTAALNQILSSVQHTHSKPSASNAQADDHAGKDMRRLGSSLVQQQVKKKATPQCHCVKHGTSAVPRSADYAGVIPAANMEHCAPLNDNETACVDDDQCTWSEIPSVKANFPKCVASDDGMDLELTFTGCGVWKEIMDCQPCLMKSYSDCPAPHCQQESCPVPGKVLPHQQCTNSDAGNTYAGTCIRGITWPQDVMTCFMSGTDPITCLLRHTPEGCPAADAFDCAFEKDKHTCEAFADPAGNLLCTWEETNDCEHGQLKTETKCRPNFDALIPAVVNATPVGLWLHDMYYCAQLPMCSSDQGPWPTTTTTTEAATTPTTLAATAATTLAATTATTAAATTVAATTTTGTNTTVAPVASTTSNISNLTVDNATIANISKTVAAGVPTKVFGDASSTAPVGLSGSSTTTPASQNSFAPSLQCPGMHSFVFWVAFALLQASNA